MSNIGLMIVVTGASGFIGSCLIGQLNQLGHSDIVAVDDFSNMTKARNLEGKRIRFRINRDHFFDWARQRTGDLDFVFHLGARTDTMEHSKLIFDELNTNYSRNIWSLCVRDQIPLIYASSAATYGKGQYGYSDDEETTQQLEPLNQYAISKHTFDLWVLDQEEKPPGWTGLKFFNVYGPNEYHKGRMSSMVYQAYQQIKSDDVVKLFKSYNPDFPDGGQQRDFIYVRDITNLLIELMGKAGNQIFNVGTGRPEAFRQLVDYVFEAIGQAPRIEYIPMPEKLKDRYQYITKANLESLEGSGYKFPKVSLKEGIQEYVQEYLLPVRYV